MRRITPPLVAVFAFCTACTAILVPGEPGFEPCDTSEDCDVPDDTRHEALCVKGGDQSDQSKKVCVSSFIETGCSPEEYPATFDFQLAFDAAVDAGYDVCVDPAMELGKQGCPGNASICDDPLELNDYDICDDTDDDTLPALQMPPDLEGRDVQDQFCRWFFCDSNYICDTSGTTQLCKLCDPDADYADGGCGEIYIKGQKSATYLPEDDGNCGGNDNPGEAAFGNL
jgi:hypothetical protein